MPHVVVIGAGVAGQAATRLLSNKRGFTVTVLEASSRSGGRIKPATVGGETVDLGASWMHSIRNNPLFDEALAKDWPMGFTDNLMAFYTEHGRVGRAAGVLPIIDDVRCMIAEDFHQEKPLKAEGSLRSYIEAAVKSMPLITSEQAQLAPLLMKQTEHFVGQSWESIPAGEGGNQEELGRNAFVYGKGYTQVLDWIRDTTNWDTAELKLSEEVQSVKVGSDKARSVVETNSGTYEADFVICTIPLGALKLSFEHLFQPALPPALSQAIVQTDTAFLGKVVLQFDAAFWDTEEQELSVVHTETHEILSIINPYAADAATIIVLTGPPITQRVESNPTTAFEAVKWALEAIRVDTSVSVPQPTACIVTDWSQAPHFRCSYSARSIGQNYNDMVQPFIDGAGTLRFAGEHTTFDGNGCVHGAYGSGIREAEHILASSKSASLQAT